MSYLRYLCLFAQSDAKHILCCGFLFCFSSPCLPKVVSSLYCLFCIAPSVLSDVYFQTN